MKVLISCFLVTIALLSITSAVEKSVIRLNATIQPYNQAQPWDKIPPKNRRALVTYLGDGMVLTTAEMVADAAYLEFETIDGNRRFPAKVNVIDYEANLALITGVDEQSVEKLSSLLEPVTLAEPSKIGNEVTVLQVEANGVPLKTKGVIRGVEAVSSFVPGNFFLTYEIKAAMQSAASSYSIPVFKNGNLLGILSSYNGKDQLLDVIAPEIIAAFLEDAKDGDYKGFPRIGLGTSRTTDPHFRSWLKLDENVGGLYITTVKRNSSASKAGIKKGDVLLAVDGQKIDRQGYFKSEMYGELHWSHLIRAARKMGEVTSIKLSRNGEEKVFKVKLEPMEEGILPAHTYDRAPAFLVKGGLIFQELSGSYLRAFGDKWRSRAPISLLDVFNHPEDYEEGRNRVVFLSAVIPTPATLGYEKIRSIVVTKVNDKPVADIKSLMEAFKDPDVRIHKIELAEEPKTIYLSEDVSKTLDEQLLQRGLPVLSRF